ncbi:MAG: 5'-methylthioadenosine/adenosylhomocysteine nucleosidase [Bacteroidales bacterium]|nr:5'-methylthioadenosine/adenosylhomocysteine nucleosidase [Bacteroidales bacterium]
MNKKVGIIGAMDVEVELLNSIMKPAEGCGAIKTTNAGSCTFTEGSIDGIPVVVVQSGIGKVNAALCAQRLIMQFGVTHVINSGIAGAIAHGLRVQDVVVSTSALYHDMDVVAFGHKICEIPEMDCSDFPADEAMVKAAQKAFASLESAKGHQILAGRIASGDQFVASKDLKDEIVRRCSPMCVEMEGAAVAHACYLNKTPYVVIRCMSDMADDNGEETYSFNKIDTANMSANLVRSMLPLF